MSSNRWHLAAIALAAAHCPPAAAQPARPTPPTVAACSAYRTAAREQQVAIYKAISACMKGPTQFGYGEQCGADGTLRTHAYMAWTQCSRFARQECEIAVAVEDGYRCEREAAASDRAGKLAREADEKLAAVNKAEKQAKSLMARYNEAKEVFNDPRRFAATQLLKGASNSLIDQVFRKDGDFTESGSGYVQETYDFLFARTIGEKSFRSTNPIIRRIQGEAAGRIRAAHSHMLAGMQSLRPMMDDATAPQTGAPNFLLLPSPNPERPRPATVDCRILATAAGIEMSIEDPAAFDALRRKCP